jgi:hypothetical protein
MQEPGREFVSAAGWFVESFPIATGERLASSVFQEFVPRKLTRSASRQR